MKLKNMIISFIMSVHLSELNNSAPIGQIFVVPKGREGDPCNPK